MTETVAKTPKTMKTVNGATYLSELSTTILTAFFQLVINEMIQVLSPEAIGWVDEVEITKSQEAKEGLQERLGATNTLVAYLFRRFEGAGPRPEQNVAGRFTDRHPEGHTGPARLGLSKTNVYWLSLGKSEKEHHGHTGGMNAVWTMRCFGGVIVGRAFELWLFPCPIKTALLECSMVASSVGRAWLPHFGM